MAENTSTIKPAGGGDFTTLQSWEDWADGETNAAQWAECYQGGDLGEVRLYLWSATITASDHPRIYAAPGHRHNAKDNNVGAYIQVGSSMSYGIEFYFIGSGEVDGLRIIDVPNACTGINWVNNDDNQEVLIENCLIITDGTATTQLGIRIYTSVDSDGVVRNNIIYAKGTVANLRGGIELTGKPVDSTPITFDTKVFNNTVNGKIYRGFVANLEAASGHTVTINVQAQNNIATNASNCYDKREHGTGTMTLVTTGSSHNLSSDATGDDWGSTGSLINKSASDQFVDPDEDWTLKSTADARRAGTDLSAEGFDRDALGCMRPERYDWDMGALQLEEIRVTSNTYDFRNRLTDIDGEEDFYQKNTYDNLDRTTKVDRHDTTSGGNLIGRQETFYDDRNRVYQTKTYEVDPSDGSVGNALIGDNFFDAAGNATKTISPGAGESYQANTFDNLGRQTNTKTAYEDGTSTEQVIEESVTTFDDASNVLTVELEQRNTDAATFRSSYIHNWYDCIDRPIATADYGTDNTARPSTTPARSDTILVSSTEYDADTGDATKTFDPKNLETRQEFDDAGRVTKIIENHTGSGTPASPNDDDNRTTEFTFNADGNQATITAKMASSSDDQVTTYVYGTTFDDSDVASNLLLRAIEYPDKASASDRVEMSYNRLQQVVERKDQLGSVHTYDYDELGRQVQDRVTTLASGVDGAVRRIETAYEVRGMVEKITSYDDPDVGEGSIVNEVQFVFNDFSQLITEYQSHSGAVNEMSTPKVQYAFASGASSSNQIRQTSITYPDGKVVTFNYGTAGEANDMLNRVESIDE